MRKGQSAQSAQAVTMIGKFSAWQGISKRHNLDSCYGRPLLQAASRANTIPDNGVRENSIELSVYGSGFWCPRSQVRILPGPYMSTVHLLICFFVTDFVHKMGTRPGLAIESLTPCNVQIRTFCQIRLSVINK